MEPETISIIGGQGRMGAFMARLFNQAGYQVSIFDPKTEQVSWEDAARSDVVLVAVPIPAVWEVMEKIGPHTRPDGAVIDIASLKQQPLQAMLQHCRGEVIGSHPLFGPKINSMQNQILFVCPARSSRWIGWYRSFFKDCGAKVIDIDPEHHDRLMSRIQVLRHLSIFCFGRALMRLGFDLESEAALAGPWFSELTSQLSRQLEQSPDLFADLAIFNPTAGQVMEEFLQAAGEVAETFGSQDRRKITGFINEMSSSLRPVSGRPPYLPPENQTDR
ncbi:MAG: prephenate dehydrogenase/arogenate dehydrogenase family protein [Pseudomonadota bacterium]